ALASAQDRLAFETASSLAAHTCSTLARPDDAVPWLRHAEAIHARLGRPPALTAALEHARGSLAKSRNELSIAADHFQRSLDSTPEHTQAWIDRRKDLAGIHLSRGQLDLAHEIFEELLAAR